MTALVVRAAGYRIAARAVFCNSLDCLSFPLPSDSSSGLRPDLSGEARRADGCRKRLRQAEASRRRVGEGARKAALRWICRHDLSGAHGKRVSLWLRLAIGARHGARAGWHGVDVFHFDAAGQITAKYTYANYDRPKLSRDLGVRL